VDIGIFGGTFDPIHCGHLAVAETVKFKLRLSRMIFVPTGQPWLKEGLPVSPAQDRAEMVRLAIAGKRDFALSTMEVERPGPSYTVDTLEVFRQELGREASLFFLLGSDAIADFHKWKEPKRIIEMCHLVAFSRPGFRLPSLDLLEKAVPGVSERVVLVEGPDVDVSATEVRRRAAQGLSISGMVPAAVERYIEEKRLYAGLGN
jgi:nicotinate-nucleotide adenylyltransferase